ncbi:MAG TPA: diaminopimelate epimerase [Rhodothermales bacterium]|nr:diaminopimelate epimerase [Rhodothermales bacterium]
MPPKLVLEFTKMNGAGNDFIVIDNRFYHFSDEELFDLARRLCPRRTGIGSDGLLAFARPADAAHHYRMRYVNADGSLGTMCGNGARCLARFARQVGLRDEEMLFESDAGVYRAIVPAEDDADVRLYVKPPKHWQPNKPLTDASVMPSIHYLWTGTEHAVCFVDQVRELPVGDWGPVLRHDAALKPNGANIDFVEVLDSGSASSEARLRVRTFEKGVEAETLACGTGAMASALVARFLGHIGADTVVIEMPGGLLRVGFRLDGDVVQDLYLEGPAESVYRGTVEV